MPALGWAHFDEPYVLDNVYLDGTWHQFDMAVQISKAQGLFALPTHAGTDIAQRPYRGEGAAADFDKLTFSFTKMAAQQLGWEALKLARAKCQTVYFSLGVPDWAVFNVTNGATFTMPRPFAYDVIGDIDSADYPTRVYLNGVLTPGAASFVGRTGTALATGQIAVHYTPVTLVYFTQFNESIPEHNHSEIAVVLEECLQP